MKRTTVYLSDGVRATIKRERLNLSRFVEESIISRYEVMPSKEDLEAKIKEIEGELSNLREEVKNIEQRDHSTERFINMIMMKIENHPELYNPKAPLKRNVEKALGIYSIVMNDYPEVVAMPKQRLVSLIMQRMGSPKSSNQA